MPALILHIGVHKTGSTAIQHGLKCVDNPDIEGWRYIGNIGGIEKRLKVCTEYDERIVTDGREILRSAIRSTENEDDRCSRLIISKEAMAGEPRRGYTNSGFVARMLREMTHDLDARIVVYLRRQDEWIESMYGQQVKSGQANNFLRYIQRIPAATPDYNRFLQEYEAAFGSENLIVRSYRKAFTGGVVRDFGRIIGSNSLMSSHRRTLNPGLSPATLQILKLARRQLTRNQRKILRAAVEEAYARPESRPVSFFSPADRQEFLRRFEDSNRAVAERYFEDDVSGAFGFPNETRELPNDVDGFSAEEVAALAVALLSRQDAAG